MKKERQLDAREREILDAIVRQYIATGFPIGSKAVAEHFPESLSAATIRNSMSDLEAAGFLSQPHISAGRIPTDKAYRFYVDRVAGTQKLSPATERFIDASLRSEEIHPDTLMGKISRVLSEVSHSVGLVLGPGLEEKLLEHIKFVRLPDQRILAVIVSKPDLIENRVVRVEEEISQDELDRTAEYLNAEFRGWSFGTIRLEVFRRLEEMKHLCDQLITNAARLLMWGTLAEESPGTLFIDGATKFLDLAEFEDVRKIKRLLVTFEEKATLVKILNACLQTTGDEVRIFIGRENTTREMQECTLIVAPYRYRDRVVGALGVVGPTRMEYSRAITAVEYVAHLCSKLLSIN